MAKLGFYISGKSGRLKKFIEQADRTICESIKIVISEYNIESGLREVLEKKDIAYKVFDYKMLGSTNSERNSELSAILLRELSENKIDYCFSFGSHILSGKLLVEYCNRIINFHPSLLPMYPGMNAVDKAVNDSRSLLLVGNTAHFIDEGVDSGPIIMQSVIPMQAFGDTEDYSVILDLQIDMLNQIIEIINKDCISIQDGRVRIKNADYSRSAIFPLWKQ